MFPCIFSVHFATKATKQMLLSQSVKVYVTCWSLRLVQRTLFCRNRIYSLSLSSMVAFIAILAQNFFIVFFYYLGSFFRGKSIWQFFWLAAANRKKAGMKILCVWPILFHSIFVWHRSDRSQTFGLATEKTSICIFGLTRILTLTIWMKLQLA